MAAVIKSIKSDSLSEKSIIVPGDTLLKINGHVIHDVLDYMYYSNDGHLLLEFKTRSNKVKLVNMNKPEGLDIGIEFETFLLDKEHSCTNKCIFCFIDQLPQGMRNTLYYKDDDVRYSFLQGNYITLTNLSRRDIERIIELKISPLNISVHSLDPKLRAYIMGNTKAAATVNTLKTLVNAGITLNCQIVCCPGINDGSRLVKTIEAFIELGERINSVSIVPVGLTKHRQNLTKLLPFDKELARKTIREVEYYGDKSMKTHGSRVFYCSDELYMTAEMELPSHEFYEDYPQLENGVGMMRLFITDFENEMKNYALRGKTTADEAKEAENKSSDAFFSIVTGESAHKYLTKLLKTAKEKYGTISCEVYSVKNMFFGDSVTVSGLLTGGDILTELKDKQLGVCLLIPQNMLRHGDDVFLDNMSVSELSNALGVPIRVLGQSGAELFRAIRH